MKNIINKILKLLSVSLSLFNLLLFFAMRCCWSGISKTLGYGAGKSMFLYNLPLFVCILFLFVAIFNVGLYFLMNKKKNLWAYLFLFFDVVFLVVNIVIIILGAIDYMYFVWPSFFKSLLVVSLVSFLIWFVVAYPKSKLQNSRVFKFCCILTLIVSSVSYLVNVQINRFTYKPVVYAVEDNYQIIFSSSSPSLAWVNIDGRNYHELSAGSQSSTSKVHKIEVPMEVLDNAKEYTIHSQRVIYRGPFGGYKGNILSEKYSFRPVDSSDGLDYYCLSDIHMELEGAKKAADYNKDKEFLVIAGDTISMVDSYRDAQYVNKVAYELTKGEIPVVHAMGNHEIKGKYSEQLHKFLPSVNNKYYFTFKFDDVYGIVLDIGEDHDDDWWEYYGTASYDVYRQEQIDFLNEELNKKEYQNYKYKMAICHIPVVFVNSRKDHEYCKKEMTRLLNEFDLDICLSGHQHDLFVFEPNTITPYEKLKYNPLFKNGSYKGYLTDFNFPNLLISKRGYTQTDDESLTLKSHIGLSINVDFNNNLQVAKYNSSNHELVNIVNPFAEISYGKEIKISLITKEFEKTLN